MKCFQATGQGFTLPSHGESFLRLSVQQHTFTRINSSCAVPCWQGRYILVMLSDLNKRVPLTQISRLPMFFLLHLIIYFPSYLSFFFFFFLKRGPFFFFFSCYLLKFVCFPYSCRILICPTWKQHWAEWCWQFGHLQAADWSTILMAQSRSNFTSDLLGEKTGKISIVLKADRYRASGWGHAPLFVSLLGSSVNLPRADIFKHLCFFTFLRYAIFSAFFLSGGRYHFFRTTDTICNGCRRWAMSWSLHFHSSSEIAILWDIFKYPWFQPHILTCKTMPVHYGYNH